MPQDVRMIPYAELVKDLGESLVDIGLCERAINLGVERYPGIPDPAKRKEGNAQIVHLISEELKRRGRDLEGPFPMTPLEGP